MFCPTCGHIGDPRSATPGSIMIEIILWLCLLIPGLIYSIWRLSKRHNVCAACGAATLIPATSPAAQARMRELRITPPAQQRGMTRPPSRASAQLGQALGKLAGKLRK